MSNTVRVIQFGLGPIGCATARLVHERENLELVGAVDIDPAKIGTDVGELIGLGRALGIEVKARLAEVGGPADVVVHTTNSFFDLFIDELLEILAAGLDIVSTSEELTFPWLDHPDQAAQVDGAARRAGKTVLGTGVNPGFLMDALPLFMTSISQRVDHIDIARVVNASQRRGPFQAKIGSGMTVELFQSKMAEGRMGHVGLIQSTAMILDSLGKELVRFESHVDPIVAEVPVRSEFFDVQPGLVRGMHQTARAYTGDGEFLSLTFRAALGEEPAYDAITVSGCPDLSVRLRGTNGDLATVAIAVNAIRRAREAAPGLVTMRDLPIVTVS
jgi:4-hydroxy-tetrahydrodipicolinate reductase